MTTYQSEGKPVTDLQWVGKVFSPALLPTEMLSVLAEKDIWASSATGPMRATCGCCRTIATANWKSQIHTHKERSRRCMKALLNWWGLIDPIVSRTGCGWGGGWVDGWGIRECFIQHVLTSLSVVLIYTAPPPLLASALLCVNHILKHVSVTFNYLLCLRHAHLFVSTRPSCTLHSVGGQWDSKPDLQIRCHWGHSTI